MLSYKFSLHICVQESDEGRKEEEIKKQREVKCNLQYLIIKPTSNASWWVELFTDHTSSNEKPSIGVVHEF